MFLIVSLCVSFVAFFCIYMWILSMCSTSLCLLSLWVRGLSQGQFTKSVGPRDRGCSTQCSHWSPNSYPVPFLSIHICVELILNWWINGTGVALGRSKTKILWFTVFLCFWGCASPMHTFVFLSVSLCVSCVVIFCVSLCLLFMCMASVSLLSMSQRAEPGPIY